MAYTPPPCEKDKRPFDFLNERKGKTIAITFNDGNAVVGTLLCFDIHLNICIKTFDGPKLIRGGSIKYIEDSA